MSVPDIVPFSESEAIEWVTRVNIDLTALVDLIGEGYRRQAWKPLGFKSWAAMCEAKIALPHFKPEQRRELVSALRAEQLSTRAIGAVTGVSQRTVVDDIAGEQNHSPVIGTDGKQYQPSNPGTAAMLESVETVKANLMPVPFDDVIDSMNVIQLRLVRLKSELARIHDDIEWATIRYRFDQIVTEVMEMLNATD